MRLQHGPCSTVMPFSVLSRYFNFNKVNVMLTCSEINYTNIQFIFSVFRCRRYFCGLTSSPSSECWESWSWSIMPASSSVGPLPTRTPPNFCVPCWVSPVHDEDTPVCSKDCSRFSAGVSSLFLD